MIGTIDVIQMAVVIGLAIIILAICLRSAMHILSIQIEITTSDETPEPAADHSQSEVAAGHE